MQSAHGSGAVMAGNESDNRKDVSNGANGSTAKQYTLQQHGYTQECTNCDVLLGRGYAPTLHEGNVRFRNHIATRKDEYVNSKNRNNKSKIAREVANWVFQNNGRFIKKLELDEVLQLGLISNDEYKRLTSSAQNHNSADFIIPSFYELADDETIMDKAKQSLRQMEKLPRSSNRAKKNSTDDEIGESLHSSHSSVVTDRESLSSLVSANASSASHENGMADANALRSPARFSVSLPISRRSLAEDSQSPIRRYTEPNEVLRSSVSDITVLMDDQYSNEISYNFVLNNKQTDSFDNNNKKTNFLEDQRFISLQQSTIAGSLTSSYTEGVTSDEIPDINVQIPAKQLQSLLQQVQQLKDLVSYVGSTKSLENNEQQQDKQQDQLAAVFQQQESDEQQQDLLQLQQQMSQLAEYFPNASQQEILEFLQSIGSDEPSIGISPEVANLHFPVSVDGSTFLSSATTNVNKADINLNVQVLGQTEQYLDPGIQFNKPTENLREIDVQTQQSVQLNKGELSNEQLLYIERMNNQMMFQQQQLQTLPPLEESLNESQEELVWADGEVRQHDSHDHTAISANMLSSADPERWNSIPRYTQYSYDYAQPQQFRSFSGDSNQDDMLAHVCPEILQRIQQNIGNGGNEQITKPLFSVNGSTFARRGSVGSNRRGSMGSAARRGSITSMSSSRRSSANIRRDSMQSLSIEDLANQLSSSNNFNFTSMDDLLDSFSMMSTDGLSVNRNCPRERIRMSLVTSDTIGTIENLGNIDDMSFGTLETNIFSIGEDNGIVEDPVKLPMLGMEANVCSDESNEKEQDRTQSTTQDFDTG